MRTIPQLLADAAAAGPDRLWLLSGDESFTFAATEDAVANAAEGLAGLGVGRGDIVLVVARNSAAHVFTWLGLAQLGAVMLPVNPGSTADELGGFLDQVQPALLVCDTALDPVVAAANGRRSRPVTVVDVHELLGGCVRHASAPGARPPGPGRCSSRRRARPVARSSSPRRTRATRWRPRGSPGGSGSPPRTG